LEKLQRAAKTIKKYLEGRFQPILSIYKVCLKKRYVLLKAKLLSMPISEINSIQY
jgi:hypothetical protein